MKTTRKLNFGDTFKIAKIIGKTGMKNDLISLFQRGRKGESTDKLGMAFMDLLMEKLPLAEKEIYSFLGGLSNKKAEEIEASEVGEIIELIGDVFATNEDIKSFFISALRSPTAEFSTKS